MRSFTKAVLLAFFLAVSACACPRLSPPSSIGLSGPVDEGFIRTEKGVEIHQDQTDLPILVVVLPTAKDWFDEVAWAADDWNTRVGTLLFLVIQSEDLIPPTKGIVPVTTDPVETGKALTHYTFRVDGVMGPTFIVMPTGRIGIRAARLIAEHELGHVLGLAHDDDLPLSLMHPSLESLDEAPTRSDIDRLRKMYVSTSTAPVSRTATGTTTVDVTPPIPDK